MNLSAGERLSVSEWLLLALVALVPLMKPAITYPVIFIDLVFVLLCAVLALELALRRRPFRWNASFPILLAYVLSLAPSLLATPSLGQSAFKLLTQAYLAGLAAVMVVLVRDLSMVKKVVLAWLAAAASLVVVALAALIAFLVAPDSAIYGYSRFHLGTLPPGHYPRLALTFFNANMACNYLIVSLGLAFVAWREAWIGPAVAWSLLGGMAVAAAATISPGLGGVALILGLGLWMRSKARLALAAGGLAALAFLFAAAFTPILHPTAPFIMEIAGITLAPSGRFLTWSAAFSEFLRHPIAGHGIGIDAVSVAYRDPSGNLQRLTDAHNVILSIASQAGIVGLAGLGALVVHAARLSRSGPIAEGVGITFLVAFLYQGMSGSFEDTRHLWLLLGLLAAAARLPVTHPDGRNHRAGGPLPC